MSDWRRDAACRDHDPELFFPLALERGRAVGSHPDVAPAVAVCLRCPVRADCHEWAAEVGAQHGVFGGLTPHERAVGFAGPRPAPVEARPWTTEDDRRMLTMAAAGHTQSMIAAAIGRTEWAIQARVQLLRRKEKEGASA